MRLEVGLLLLEAKGEDNERLSTEEFRQWCRINFGIGLTQAYEYIKLTDEEGRSRRNSGGPKKGSKRKKVALPSDDDEEREEAERRTQRKLALELTNIGYKALAVKLHPDQGGSTQEMSRLTQVRDQVRTVLKDYYF